MILFVGVGMGVSTLTSARINKRQLEGNMGEEGYLSFETFSHTALVKIYNVDAQTPDSAGTMTAMMSGLKTDVGVIGVDEDIERGECATVEGNEVITALELAEIRGLSTGIVSTARITHATPGYHQEALIPLGSETHSGEDVGIYAKGPGAFLVNGTNEQSVIFHVMDFAADFVSDADSKLE